MMNSSPGMGHSTAAFAEGVTALLGYLSRQQYSFITVTPATHARILARRGGKAAGSLRSAFGWNAEFDANLLPSNLFARLREGEVITPSGTMWRSSVRVSSLQALLLAHSSFPTNDADAVFFGPDTYRFTSAIMRRLQADDQITRAVDIGCGTGAAGILIARSRPNAEVFLSDINSRALQYASVNAATARVANVSICRSDILSQLQGQFDFIVANPPYLVDAKQRSYRHGGGSTGTELGSSILEAALERLTPNGRGLIYTGAPVAEGEDLFRSQAEAVLGAHAATWTYEELDPDVFGEELEQPAYATVERIAAVVLEFRKR